MISRKQALERANQQLRADGCTYEARHATREKLFRAWVVSYVDPDDPDAMLCGGGLVVTDEGDVHNVDSAPGSVERLMDHLGRWPEPPQPEGQHDDSDFAQARRLLELDPGERLEHGGPNGQPHARSAQRSRPEPRCSELAEK